MTAAALLALLQAGPDPAIAPLLQAGRAALEAGRPAEALAPFGEAVRRRPNAPDAHFYLGGALHRLGRHAEAVAELARADELGPGNEPVEWALGLAAAARGDYALAAGAFSKVVAKSPGRAEALFNLGVVQRRRGASAEGTAALLRAWAIDPAFPGLAAVLAEGLLDDGELERAEEVAARGVARAPGDGTLLFLLGRAKAGRGDVAGAIEALDRAVAAAKDPFPVLEERSLARARAGDLAGAEADCRAALVREATSAGMLYHLGVLLQRQGRREEARAAFERHRAEAPLLADLKTNLDRAARNPLDGQAHSNVAFLYLQLDRIERAAEAIRRAIEAQPALGQDRTVRGILLLAAGKAAEGREEFEAARAERPDFPGVHLGLQRCCERLGRAEEAAGHRARFEALTASKRR
ncbi:MAG TPA: tetratricopeptide repeat protein [Planctomycetota bacterium]|jgi:tetratricopeptide (TPR) repeat protein|nr:tetratricopeptide repeat protein [Planctomycetota bacterium]